MKYMIMMFGDAGTMLEERPADWVRDMIAFMQKLDVELRDAGELVYAAGLADSSQARVVSLREGTPVVTDGPFAEAKESLIGFWVLDVDGEERLLDIAGRIVAWSQKVELRPVQDAPPEL